MTDTTHSGNDFMSSSSFRASSFIPVDDRLVMMGETQVQFSFSSAYATQIRVDLWSEEDNGASHQDSKTTSTDGANDVSLIFDNFPLSVNMHYRITITGEDGSENVVYVKIEW
jgi:hypothetical protein